MNRIFDDESKIRSPPSEMQENAFSVISEGGDQSREA